MHERRAGEPAILAIERPHPNLMKLYAIRALLSGPGLIVLLPLLYFRYHTLRYRFDREGVHMRWGILFRREVNLTYARIQDIHLVSGILQRWLGLADLKIQTASGSGSAEMTIEGLLEFEQVRDFLYHRMRGYRDHDARVAPAGPRQHGEAADGTGATATGHAHDLTPLLGEIRDDLRGARLALERLAAERSARSEEAKGTTQAPEDADG